MFRFNDIFLVIVACYVIYKIGFVDGFTFGESLYRGLHRCGFCIHDSSSKRIHGEAERKEHEAVKKREEKKEVDKAKKE